MKEYIEIIECRDCESKNCYGCNILTLAEMLNSGAFDGMMDEHHSIIPAAKVVEAPCDIGDVFWRIDPVGKQVDRVKVSGLTKKANGTWKIRITCYYGVYEIVPSEIGKHVFRTEEEAEAALNERVH